MADYYRRLPGHMIHALKTAEYFNTEKCSEKPGISFFVTRNPYTRLYSAFVDKIFLEKFGSLSVLIDAVYNKKIPKEIPDGISSVKQLVTENNWLCDTAEVTFQQFLLYVSRARHLDPHYTPVSLLCNPCKDPVDFIFRQEDLHEDAEHLYEYLNKTLQKNGFKNVDLHLEDYVGDGGVENLVRTHHVAWTVRFQNHNCELKAKTRDVIYRRLWEALKMLGNIDENLEYIPDIFKGNENELKDPDAILYDLWRYKITPLSPSERAQQRHRYLVKAYKSVHPQIMKGIQSLFQLDFQLFDYDINPPS